MTTSILTKAFKGVAVLTLILQASAAQAQYAPGVEQYREEYPNTGVVRLQQETELEIKYNKGEIEIAQKVLEEDLYLDEGAIHNSKRSLYFSSFYEIRDIEAATFVPDGGKFIEKEVKNFTEKDELENSFFDDSRSINFIFPDLKKGSRSRLEYTELIKNPRFLMPFYFGDYSPIISNKYTVTVDEEIDLRFLQFNTEHLNLKFTEDKKRGKKIYTWETGEVPQYFSEDGGPSYKDQLPHIIPVISSYVHDGKEVQVLNNVDDLFGWYSSMVEGLNEQAPDPGLVKLVGELTADKESELEKVRAIYYWTQKNIKYIAFEYALGGFIPREANLVFQKKYGDCKDNSSILQEMLEIAGLDGQLTWIGTRSIPYTYAEMPTPMVDNHMILSYVNNGNTYYLDATGRYLPLEFPSAFIQGKEALVANGDGTYTIKQVPIVPASKNAFTETTNLEITADRITGKSVAEISGYFKIDFFNNIEATSNETKLKELYNSFFTKGNNKFLIGNFSETNKFSYDEDFQLSYDFEVRDYAQRVGDEIYLNLNMNRDLANYRTLRDRKTSLEYEYKRYYSYTTHLNIPEGYAVQYVPENENFSNDHVEAGIAYELREDKLVYTHSIELKSLLLDLEDLKEMNKLIEQAEKAYKEVVILKKI